MKKAHSLDMLFLLKMIEEKYDVQSLCTQSAKIKNIYAGIVRKGFLTDEGTLTLTGKGILKYMTTPEGTKFVKKVDDVVLFDKWWLSYPGTDTFSHRGKSFKGTRALRTGKPRAKGYWDAIIEKGIITGEQIIEATQYDVQMKKEDSVIKGKNGLTFMQNAATYLYNDSYAPFIELIKGGIDINRSRKGQDVDV
jgi:hypothetical protein